MNTFSLKVIACDRVFFDGRCEQVVLPLHDGEKAIQAHHENMVFAVEIGEIRITDETGEEIVGVTGTGFAQIINNRAMVIVDTCESPEEIDVRRAEEAKEACTGAAPPETEHSGVLSFQSIAGARDVTPQGREKRPSDRILRRKMVLCKVPAGLREEKRLSSRRDLVIMRVGRKKGCSRVWE